MSDGEFRVESDGTAEQLSGTLETSAPKLMK
jgi:hypothetical protein